MSGRLRTESPGQGNGASPRTASDVGGILDWLGGARNVQAVVAHGFQVALDGVPGHSKNLRHANATGLVADGIDVKTAQTQARPQRPAAHAADKLGARLMRPCGDRCGISVPPPRPHNA